MIFRFTKFLEDQNINYLILNGYEELYNEPSDSDVDILFKKADFKIIEDIIENFCQKENLILVQIYHQDIWAKNIFLFDLTSHQILNLDTYGFLSRMNVPLFSEKELFAKGRLFKDIMILNPCHEFIYYLSKKLDKDDLSVKNFKALRKLFLSNYEDSKLILKDYFPTTNTLIKESFINNDIELIKREVLIKDISKRATNTFKDIYKNSKRKIKRIINPTGFTLTFLGPDGSGKSTIINLLTESNLPFRQIKYFHLKPISNKTSKAQVINPHSNPKYSPVKSYIKLLYLIFQYNLGWLKNIVPLKIKSTLVIFDRYYDDLLVDTKRYRYGGSLFLAKFVKKLIPKPNIYFVLITKPQIVYNRKKEVSFQELERQIDSYKTLANNDKFYILDANESPNEIKSKVINTIMQNMNKRYS